MTTHTTLPFGPTLMSASWLDDDEHEPALVTVVATRATPDGDLLMAVILVDRAGRGVNNAFVGYASTPPIFRRTVAELARGEHGGLLEATVLEAQSVVYHAIAFARSQGFAPHPDFAHARRVLGERPSQLLDTPLARPSRARHVSRCEHELAIVAAKLACSAQWPGREADVFATNAIAS